MKKIALLALTCSAFSHASGELFRKEAAERKYEEEKNRREEEYKSSQPIEIPGSQTTRHTPTGSLEEEPVLAGLQKKLENLDPAALRLMEEMIKTAKRKTSPKPRDRKSWLRKSI